jgi:nucleoside-diphosphate-sugar epimerase
MRIAITGGSGRVGRAVVEMALAQGHRVVSIDRVDPTQETRQPDLSLIKADLTQYDEVEPALRGCEAVIHLAAIPSPGRHPDHVVHNNNVVSNYNVLSAATTLRINRICQASSINATGVAYSRWPRFNYFPLDEQHPTYNEDPYSLSKWICEQQSDSFVRRYEDMTISSLRFHWVVAEKPKPPTPDYKPGKQQAKNLWGYTLTEAAARACLLSLTAGFKGHEVFYIVAPHTLFDIPSRQLAQEFFPEVPVRGNLDDNRSLFDCSKAERWLGWKHDEEQ